MSVCRSVANRDADPISMAALKAVAVYSLEPRMYQLMDPQQKQLYQMQGFTLIEDEGITRFTAYDRFRFADVLLVCSQQYDPRIQTPTDIPTGCVQVINNEIRRLDAKGQCDFS